jgi:hypothetical protein
MLYCLFSVLSTGLSITVWDVQSTKRNACSDFFPQISTAVSPQLKYAYISWEYLFVHLSHSGRDPVNVRILEGGSMNSIGAGQ